MRILVCGDRNYNRKNIMDLIFTGIKHIDDRPHVCSGGASGADEFAERLAKKHGIPFEEFPANWDEHGKSAGPIRNQQMLDEFLPEVVLAFHDNLPESKGTRDMVLRAKEAGIPAFVISRI